SPFDDMLNGTILVIRRSLDTVTRRSDLGTLSTPPNTRYSPEFWMKRTDMRRGAGYRRPELGELLAEHFKKVTGIGRKTPFFGYPAQKLGLAIGRRGIESVGHIAPEVSQVTSPGASLGCLRFSLHRHDHGKGGGRRCLFYFCSQHSLCRPAF